jgi:HEAT repeat protein
VDPKDLPPPELREILLDLASSDAELRARGAESAKRFPDKAVAAKHLIPLLQDKDPEIRAIAASTLGDLKQPEAVAPLAKILEKGDRDPVRAMALKALGDIGGPKARDALRALVRGGAESSDRAFALGMLVKMKEVGDVKDLVPAALDDLNEGVRMQAVLAIREFKIQGFESQLMKRLEDFSEQVAQEAVRALVATGGRAAVPTLVRMLVKPDPDLEDPEAMQGVLNQALVQITGVDFGYDPTHPDDVRAEAIDRWRLWWEKNKATWK